VTPLWCDQYRDLVTFLVTWNSLLGLCGSVNKKDNYQSALIYWGSFPGLPMRMKLDIPILEYLRVYIYFLSDICVQCLPYNESFNFLFSFPLSLKRMDYGEKTKIVCNLCLLMCCRVISGTRQVCLFYECLLDCNYLTDLETCLYSCRH
jgi:hypothetical protein